MNKSDLKDGMVVELRNGKKEVAWGKDLYEIHALKLTVTNCINNYNNDLHYTFTDDKRNLDIMKVSYNDELIWERNEVDWSKVHVGTKVLVSDNKIDWHEYLFIKYDTDHGDYKFKCIYPENKSIHNWQYCKLAEDLKEEVTYKEMMESIDEICDKNYKKNKTCCGCIAFNSDGLCNRSVIADDSFTITRK